MNDALDCFPRDTVVSCYLAVGFMVIHPRKHSRPLIFLNAVGNVFWPRPSLCLNDKGLLAFL